MDLFKHILDILVFNIEIGVEAYSHRGVADQVLLADSIYFRVELTLMGE
jgi:hypothetical protein